MTPDLVSVVMPAYNHEAHVGLAMHSVLDQTHAELELIVVDDGSTDGTWDVIRSVADPRVQTLTHVGHVNRGLHETLRRGVHAARGEWIAFLASDDIMWPQRIERQVATAADLSYGRARLVDASGEPVGVEWGVPPANGRTPFGQLLVSNVVPAPTVLLRRPVFDIAGGFLGTEVFEDLDLFLRVFALTDRVTFLDEVLADYRVSTTGIAASVSRAGRDTAAYASAVAHVASWPGLPAKLRPSAESAARAWEALLARDTGAPPPPLSPEDELLLAAVEAARAPVSPPERPSLRRRLLRRLA